MLKQRDRSAKSGSRPKRAALELIRCQAIREVDVQIVCELFSLVALRTAFGDEQGVRRSIPQLSPTKRRRQYSERRAFAIIPVGQRPVFRSSEAFNRRTHDRFKL